MRLTREQLEQIYDWLQKRTIRDTEFPVASPLNGQEHIPIIQDKANKIMNINELISQLPYDFYNITAKQKRDYNCIEDVANDIPVLSRKLGFVVTFRNTVGNWDIYQFTGSSLAQWTHKSCWNNLIKEALKDVIFYPDEEDLTWRQDKDKKLIYFRNRYIDPEEFIGQGFIILRRNIAGSEECFIDDEDHLINILEQKAINEKNTIYVIQYDFDLAGKSINIPENSVLWFQGGSINNGSIYCNNTAIWGAYEFSEMGDCKVYGTFNTGQILTFRNNEYKKKEGGYFQTTREIQTMAVSPDVIEEFYEENPEAYKESERQELRWWNGEEWILILDVTDYNEIKSIIQDLIEKHNKEIAACYKYFKDRCTVIEQRLSSAESRISGCEERLTQVEGRTTTLENKVSNIENSISSINNRIENINNTLSNLKNTILSVIDEYLSTSVVGATSVTVNNNKYQMDNKGNITIPNYPEIPSHVSSSDSSSESEHAKSADVANKVAKKLKFTGVVTAEYDGSSEVTVNIPNVKEELAKDEILSAIQKYLNRKVEYWTSKINTFTSHYISKDSITCLSLKRFGAASEITDKEKQEEAIDKYIVLGKTQEEINLYEVGFSRQWLSESGAESGIIYSSNEDFIKNLTFSDFQSLGVNSADKGKLVHRTYSTGQENEAGTITTQTAFLSTELNTILDNKTKYFRSYTYIPTRDIFYMATDYDTIKAKRINNNLAPVNEYYFTSVGYERENRSCIIESEVFNPSDKTVTITVTLNNLYIPEGSTISLVQTAAGGSYPIKTEVGVPFHNTTSSSSKSDGVTISPLSQNRYKYIIDIEKAFGNVSAPNYIFYIELLYKYNPNNESNYNVRVPTSLTIYYIGIPNKTIKILERSDYSN